MPEQPNIKWRNRDNERINKAIKNFNAKVSRLSNKNETFAIAGVYPDKVQKKDLVSRIETRKDFNRIVKSLERFTKRGSEQIVQSQRGLLTTKYEKKETQYKLQAVNARRLKEYEGANISTESGTMGSILSNNLKPKKLNFENKTKEEWAKFKDLLEKQITEQYYADKRAQYKENYIKALEHRFENSKFYSSIVETIRSVDDKNFFKWAISDAYHEINFIYDEHDDDTVEDIIMEGLSELTK